MSTLFYILFSTTLISLGSLAGLITLSLGTKRLNEFLIYIVSLSAGTLMGSAFFYLIPEASNYFYIDELLKIVLLSFIVFFLIEKLLMWHHCHRGDCEEAMHGQMNLVGDSVHNFLDGLIIAAAFLTSIPLGISTSIAVALHEIPQEIGDFGVMLHSGFSKKKALFANLLVTIPAVIGGVVGFFWSTANVFLIPYFLAFAAGGFIYIATADLLPEIRQERNQKRSWLSFLIFMIGIGLILATELLEH